MKAQSDDQRSSQAMNVALWALQILAAAFFISGFGAFSGAPVILRRPMNCEWRGRVGG